jgi:predicted RNA-binding Zn-ribbon protein involved in translation (DUF1610 family)
LSISEVVTLKNVWIQIAEDMMPLAKVGTTKFLFFRCPRCASIRTKRDDSFVPGLHLLTCPACGFSQHAVRFLDGREFDITDEMRV